MITGYTNLKVIIAKLYRDLGINTEINYSDSIEWCLEALKMIGAYGQFKETSNCIELVNGKAKLPCDFYKLVDIHHGGRPMYWSTNTNASNYQCDSCDIPVCDTCELTFYINDSYLITNISTTTTDNVCMIYLAFPVDDEGYPMVPDSVYYHKALAAYITYMLDYQDWRKAKITDKVFNKSEQDWLFYVNAARGEANMPNAAQLENLKNIWRRFMPQTNEYQRHFVNLGKKEKRRLK